MEQKTCLITGATRGLGKCLARDLKQSGYHVIGLGRSAIDPAACPELDEYFQCDLASEATLDEVIRYLENNYDQLDLLVHNAGIQTPYDITESLHYVDLLRKELAVNFLTPVKLTACLLPLLMQTRSRIVVVTSLLQLGAKRSAPGYCSSKAALANWAGNLRAQLEQTGVGVTEVIPGLIKTGMTPAAREKGVPPERLSRVIVDNLERDTFVLPGARLAWAISRIAPGFIRGKLLKSPN